MKQIPLTRGLFALVDNEDYEYLNQWKWYARKGAVTYYASRRGIANGVERSTYMHRVILGLTDRKIHTDHIDHNGLNNQRANLRKCTNKENSMNHRPQKRSTTGIKGVTPRSNGNGFIAQIRANNKNIHLGTFKDTTLAAIAYNKAAIKYYGEFAYLNPVDQ